MKLPIQPDLTPTKLFNPDIKDFVTKYRDEKGDAVECIVPAYDIATFPRFLAEKIALQMADELLQKRGIRHNYLKDRTEILETIYVK